MRLYWLEEIHIIGKTLNIPTIQTVDNYWNLDHKQAATDIATVLDDEQLIKLVAEHPPKYVELGGFQGNFYTFNERKSLELNSSWDIVRKNVNKSLKKWGNRSYAILKALLNKDGRSSYIELLNEIERVIGLDYIPSSLLSRFTVLKLVFKTGSNKYPRWEIPTEVIPVLKEELAKYQIQKPTPTRKIRINPQKFTRKQEQQSFSQDLKLDNIVSHLVDRKSEINLIFDNKFKIKFFKDNERAIINISKPCIDEDEFNTRIYWLAALITDDVETSKLKKIVKNGDGVNGSIDFIQVYLNENNITYDQDMIISLKMLRILRNKRYPTHPDDGLFLDATTYFGQSKFPLDWAVLWENVLKSITESITKLRNVIQ